MKIFFLLAIILYISFHLVQGGNQHRSVLLEDVKTLTLHKGQKTQARRVSSIPQLKCVGGSAKGSYEPDVVQCYNRGSNGIDIQWECTSEMPKKYKFGKLSVSCEGYNYAEDPYILAGSCGLEYNLELTDKNYYDSSYQSTDIRHSTGSKFLSFLFKVALIVVVFFVVRSFISGNRPGGINPMSTGPDHRPPGGGGGWFSNLFPGGNGGRGGGGGGFGNWFGGAPGQGDTRRRQPPPPPGFRNDYTDFGNDGANCNTNRQQNAAAGGGGAANFLSGAALGALGGYVFGNRNRRPNNQYMPGTANTGWFGAGTTTDTHRRSQSPSSSGTHTSTGYAETTRR